MIITTTTSDAKILENQLLKYIEKEMKGGFSDSALQAGKRSLRDPLPVNKVLLERAVKEVVSHNNFESYERLALDHCLQEAWHEETKYDKLDSLDPKQSDSYSDDLPW